MKLVSYLGAGGETKTGVVMRERVIDLTEAIASIDIPAKQAAELARRGLTIPETGMLRLLYAGADALKQLAPKIEALASDGSFGRHPPLTATALLAPIPRPGKIVGVGRNYADHAKETGVDPFEKPRLFAKLPASVVGPGTAVKRPAAVTKMDFEAELAVVIGEFATNVSRDKALDVVAGYTLLDDLSAREFQFDISPPQTTFAKSMDGFSPMGPWLVTKDEVPDPQALEVRCFVNNEEMQHGRTADMIFPVDRLIEYISQFMTLEPGDVIATGTPAGVGAFRKPPVWLQPGDRIRIEISGIGVLEHGIG
jgi:2-keto-4-pentenoate hydratase/2-oxohepta-3-ene-1,7-dioic acid hydratase in catechol pathway